MSYDAAHGTDKSQFRIDVAPVYQYLRTPPSTPLCFLMSSVYFPVVGNVTGPGYMSFSYDSIIQLLNLAREERFFDLKKSWLQVFFNRGCMGPLAGKHFVLSGLGSTI